MQGQKPKYNPQKHHRRSIRLPGYDYAQDGAYFVTIVTYQWDCVFGKILDGEMILSEFGHIADECWRAIPDHFDHVQPYAWDCYHPRRTRNGCHFVLHRIQPVELG